MKKRNPLRLGTAFAATVGIGYALCTVLFRAFPDASASFMKALFHGLDFSPLANPAAFTFGAFAYALAVLVAWAFMLGSIFGWIARRMHAEA